MPTIRKQRRQQLSLKDPGMITALLTMLALISIIVTFLFMNDALYRWVSLVISTVLIAAAIIIFLRRNSYHRLHKYHTSIVEALLRSEAVPLIFLDRSGNVVEMNEASGHMLGYSYEEVVDFSMMGMVEPGSRQSLKDSLELALKGGTSQANIQITHRSGFPLELQVVCAPMTHDHEVVGTLLISQDLSDRKRNVERIRYMAYYDDMTGLPNRTLFQMKLVESLSRAREEHKVIGICYLDLDRFKLVNASFGHEFGDMLLMQVAERLSRGLSEHDFVARLEGDEFALLFYAVHSERQLLERSRSILKLVEDPYELQGFPVHISASIGMVMSNNAQDDDYSLLMKADIALVKVKESGKNDCMLYSDSWSNSSYERLTLRHEMHRAMERNEFILYYQPQYDLATGAMVGVEALIRWKHPEKGLLKPSEFIPYAEESGMIIQIGQWVLQEACRQNKAWQDAGLSPIPVSVNLSIRQFVQDDLASKVAAVLKSSKLESKYLNLEITESMTMDIGHVSRCLLDISELGIGISVDDFGTGYSSFHYLKNFPIDRLKIDRSFVRDIQSDPNDAKIVAAIIAMAHNLNIQVIAEGVETKEQMEFLRNHNCDELQGYFRSPPVPGDEIAQMLLAS